ARSTLTSLRNHCNDCRLHRHVPSPPPPAGPEARGRAARTTSLPPLARGARGSRDNVCRAPLAPAFRREPVQFLVPSPRRALDLPTVESARNSIFSLPPVVGEGRGGGGQASIDVPTPIPAFPHRRGRSSIFRLLALSPRLV